MAETQTLIGTNILNIRILKQIKHIVQIVAAIIALWSCHRELPAPGSNPDQNGGKGIGQMVLFSVGTTNSSIATKADGDSGSGGGAGSEEDDKNSGITTTPGKTYYMPNDGRFVCRMYYKASVSSDDYDVSGKSDVTTWMKVSGNVGNSLYWNKEYRNVDTSKKGKGGVDDFGNDYSATALYWQNRKKHAFLAWTNLNKLTTIPYSPDKNSGGLKFEPADVTYQKHTGQKEAQWINGGYEVYPDLEFKTWALLRTFMETGSNYESQIKDRKPAEADFTDQYFYYEYGWSCKFRYEKDYWQHFVEVDGKHRKTGWKEYQMFYDKLPYTGETPAQNQDIIYRRNSKYIPTHLYHRTELRYLAQIDIKFYKIEEGEVTGKVYTPEATDINMRTGKTYDLSKIDDGDQIRKEDGENAIAQCKFVYNLTDNYGNEKYDETNPRYVFYFRDLEEEKDQEIIEEYKANVFDLTRGQSMTSIADQPDIMQALTEQEPLGATQESNRVNLYFKHQFSQVQVNIKTSADLSVVIEPRHIRKVELLGVTEKGYVFTELDEKGKVEPATYEHVDISKYSDEHLQKNQYGTAFSMFDMANGKADYEYPTGYIKAYNAITFGQLQAIRVTWMEEGTDIEHESTYQVGNEELKNLKSGNKYVWNIELRRGTLAIVRTEIVDWIVPKDELEYGTNGTISN